MNIAIVGLGLIGGSIAKAIKYNTDNTVYGYDIDRGVLLKAKLWEPLTRNSEVTFSRRAIW